jgi:hypothetical protein
MIINQREFRVVAMQRSGHHAIINWILKNIGGTGCFLNCCEPDSNPFESLNEWDSLIDAVDLAKERSGEHLPKDYLIYNFEDKALQKIFGKNYRENSRHWLGNSAEIHTILVLRDPFNVFASKLRWARGKLYQPTPEKIQRQSRLWLEYAREFIGNSNILGQKSCVSFNAWFADTTYREELARTLGLPTWDKGVEEVAKWGPSTWGDSFDNLDYQNRASAMKVTERWKNYSDDETYLGLFADKEIIRLSNQIFGSIPGTDVLRSSS